jgi:hypothetical protein
MPDVLPHLDEGAWRTAATAVLDWANTLDNDELDLAVAWCSTRAPMNIYRHTYNILRNLTGVEKRRFGASRARLTVRERWQTLHALSYAEHASSAVPTSSRTGSQAKNAFNKDAGLYRVITTALTQILVPDKELPLTPVYRDTVALVAGVTTPVAFEIAVALASEWTGTSAELISAASTLAAQPRSNPG